MPEKGEPITRRSFLAGGMQAAGLVGLGAVAGFAARHARGEELVWQIDPSKCVKCGNCATYCVLSPSAVKCVHAYAVCGRCNFCFGYYETKPGSAPGAGAEYQLCPVGAIARTFLRDPYYEYGIDEATCIGCAKCVAGCETFGNGSLFLQVRHDRCVNCNECAIAAACPSEAFVRVPASQPYLLKRVETEE